RCLLLIVSSRCSVLVPGPGAFHTAPGSVGMAAPTPSDGRAVGAVVFPVRTPGPATSSSCRDR
ncbi:MAG: hypothetical protein R6V28_04135, partial [Nitriliruptoraceae bacterium]